MSWVWQVFLFRLLEKRVSLAIPFSLAILLPFHASSQADPVGAQRQSSYVLMSPDTKAMQDDPLLNPATFAVLDGQVQPASLRSTLRVSYSAFRGASISVAPSSKARSPLRLRVNHCWHFQPLSPTSLKACRSLLNARRPMSRHLPQANACLISVWAS